jgi:hypothetical protein
MKTDHDVRYSPASWSPLDQGVVAGSRAAGSWQSDGMPAARYGMDAPYGFGFGGVRRTPSITVNIQKHV